ncbi:MAG: ATP-binding cassette domain-containing protein [Nitratireductor sp.]
MSGGPWSVARTVENGLVRTFQQTRAFLGLTVAENFRIAAVSSGSAIDMEIIEAFDLHPLMKETAGDLSYAFLRRLGIALALSLHPKVLLLDEPAVGLTSHDLDRMASIIRARNARGVTILLVEHNMKFLMSLATRVTVLAQGRVLFEGSPEKCQSNPLVIETYLGTEAEHA